MSHHIHGKVQQRDARVYRKSYLPYLDLVDDEEEDDRGVTVRRGRMKNEAEE